MSERNMCIIQIEVVDEAPISIAQGLIEYYMKDNEKIGLIMLQELAEHIEVSVNAISRAMEVSGR